MTFVKNKAKDKIYWVDNKGETIGVWLFAFDKLRIFNMFADYPKELTAEEKELFDKENPFWADFFSDRQ